MSSKPHNSDQLLDELSNTRVHAMNGRHQPNECSIRHEADVTYSREKSNRQSALIRSVTSLVESVHSCEDIHEGLEVDHGTEKRLELSEKTEGRDEIVVLAAALGISILLGMNWIAFPVFYMEFSEYFDQSKFITGGIGSVQNALSQTLHLFVSAPIQVYGCRPVAMLGGVILCMGFALSSLASSIPYLYLTYGVVGGIGQSMLNLPTNVIIQQHFNKNRSLGASIVMTGRAVGQIIGPILIPYLIREYTWKGAVLIYGGIMLHCLPMAIFFFVPKYFKPKKTGFKQILKMMVDFSLFKEFKFVCFCASVFLVKFNVFGFFHHLPNRMVFYGYSKTMAALLLTVASSASMVGRLLSGIVGNFKCTDRTALFTSSILICGVTTVLTAFVSHYIIVAVLSGIYGAFQGTTMLMLNIVLVDHFGVEIYARSRGLLNMCSGVAGLLATPFAGWLFDFTQNYNIPFLVTGGLGLLGGLISLLAIVFTKCNKHEESTKSAN